MTEIKPKYLLIHKVTIAALLYLIVLSISQLADYSMMLFLYPLILLGYLKFSIKIDQTLLSVHHLRRSESFYYLIWIVTAAILLSIRPGREGTYVKRVVFDFFGYSGIIISIFIFISSSIIGWEIYKIKKGLNQVVRS